MEREREEERRERAKGEGETDEFFLSNHQPSLLSWKQLDNRTMAGYAQRLETCK